MMRSSLILFFILLVACHSTQKNENGSDSIIESSNIEARTDEDNLTYSCEYSEGEYDFGSVPTISELEKSSGREYIIEGEAIKIFQIVSKEINQRKPLAKKLGLSPQTLIIEYKAIEGIADRAIILWVEDAKVGFDLYDTYTCPQTTTGSGYFRGRTRVSLINTKEEEIINTIELYTPYWGEDGYDCFTIPFCIANPKYKFVIGGLKYQSIGGDDKKDGRAEILVFDDFTGNGKKLEFALYHQIGCVTAMSTLLGYNEKRDSLINYKIRLIVTDLDSLQKKADTTMSVWADDLFTLRPKNGIYDFIKDHRARAGNLNYYRVEFNSEKNIFEGTLKYTFNENDTLGLSYITYPEQR